MDKRVLAGIAAAAVAATAFGSARAASEQGVLEGRAILPAETFAPGPPSGAFIGGPVINGVPVPFASQPVQGFSAVLPGGGHRFWVMEDNGYGAKANSSDFLLRMYLVTPQFKTAHGGSGSVSVGDFIQLRDPDQKIPFALTRPDRLLTGSDFDIESVRKVKDGTLWFGDEVRPVPPTHGRDGEGARSADPAARRPGAGEPVPSRRAAQPALERRLRGDGGLPERQDAYPMLEKVVTGDDPQLRRILEFDVRQEGYTGMRWWYRLDPGSVSIGDFTQVDAHRFLVIERDNEQGATAAIKRIYEIDLRRVNPDGTLVKTLVVDLMNIADPAGISLPGRSGDIGLGSTFTFPYVTIEDVLPLDDEHLPVINDNNFPFSTGRNPARPDYEDFIVVRTPALGAEG